MMADHRWLILPPARTPAPGACRGTRIAQTLPSTLRYTLGASFCDVSRSRIALARPSTTPTGDLRHEPARRPASADASRAAQRRGRHAEWQEWSDRPPRGADGRYERREWLAG